jgi:phosphoribosyl-dephospho-CoA transferase
MSATELKITEKLSKNSRGHKEIITTDDNLSTDKQIKNIVMRIQEKYKIFGKLLDSDVLDLLESKFELIKIKNTWYIKLNRR